MKAFSDEFITRLNSTAGSGVFCKAARLVVAPGDTRYYADTQRAITFDGQTYLPLQMNWDGVEQNAEMRLPSVRVTTPNINDTVGAFLERVSLLGNDCELLILHLDLLADVTAADRVLLQCMLAEWGQESATITLGINLALTEQLPRGIISRAEFPGTPDQMRRASIL